MKNDLLHRTGRAAILFLILLLFIGQASADIYIATTGNDTTGDGTIGNPYATIQKGANVSEAGDTVYVRNGTYLEIVQPPNNGTVGNYTTFTNYNGEVVNINTSSFPPGSGAEWTGAFWIKAKHYLNVTGFNMYGGDSGVHIDKGSSFIIIKDNYIENPNHSAIKVGFGPGYEKNPEKRNRDIIIDNNTVYRNQSGTLEHQEMISIEAAERIEVKNNKVTRNKHGEGIDMKQGTYNSSIHHNVVHDTLDNGYYIDGWADNVDNISVYNNVAYNVASAGFAVGNECGNETRRTTNVTFTNNIAYNNMIGYALVAYLDTDNCGGYTPYYHYDNIKFINNIGYHNGHNETIIPSDRWSPEWGNDYWLYASGVNVTNILLRNNIAYQAYSGALVNNANATLDSNMLSGVDPKWVNASAFDFHLLSNSTAINNGSSILAPLLDFDGNARVGAVDIGAYEYQAYNISFIDPTPVNNSINTTKSIAVNTSVACPGGGCTALLNWNNSLVGWWRFNNNTGTLAEDSSGYGNNGTLTNMNTGLNNCTGNCSGWNSSGQFGNALSFDGVDDYVDAGNDTSLNITNAITIEAWIYPKPWVGSLARRIVSKEITTLAAPYALETSTGNVIRLYLNFVGEGTAETNVASSTSSPPVNTWTHVIAIWDGTNGRMYFNGVQNGTDIVKSGTINTSSNKLLIGNNPTKIRQWNGSIDEVRIYNRALSNDEINASYNASANRLFATFSNLEEGSEHNFTAYVQDSSGAVVSTETRYVTVSQTLQAPEIISWGNNFTNNQNLSISVNVGQSIRFNATANQNITNWNWSKTP